MYSFFVPILPLPFRSGTEKLPAAPADADVGGRLVNSDIFSRAFELKSAIGGLLRFGLEPLFHGPSLQSLLGTLRGSPSGVTWGGKLPAAPALWWWWWWWCEDNFLLDKSSGNDASEEAATAAEVIAFTTAAAAIAAGIGSVGDGDAAFTIAFWLKSRTLVWLLVGGLKQKWKQ